VSSLPIVEKLPKTTTPSTAFQALQGLPHVLFLDSAMQHATLGRYSFVAADPFRFIRRDTADARWIDGLKHDMTSMRVETVDGLPPFQGGVAGMFSYDLGRAFENVPFAQYDEFKIPVIGAGIYDVVLAFDNQTNEGWLISQGFPETSQGARHERAAQRCREFERYLADGTGAAPQLDNPNIPRDQLAPQYSVSEVLPDLTSNFSADQYRAAVQRAVDYIYAGDIFQVNVSQRLLHPAVGSSIDLYNRLRKINPATFGGYFDLGEFQIVSASPERFVRVKHGRVEARPIKGTRQRQLHPEADLFTGDVLRESEKDRAENVMIVDLLRNDLSRVSTPDSVLVTQLFGLEAYQYVQHLVSVVEGQLADDKVPLDMFPMAFPGGSITGAPKVRAMEIISELEPTARGPYCGSLGYLGFDGTLDLSILIRTITAGKGWWQFPVGGGIVAQSTPQAEYEETWHKAQGILQALNK
jgi:para-aminobenzoate synthetase component 1